MPSKKPKAYIDALRQLAARERTFVAGMVDGGLHPSSASTVASGYHDGMRANALLAKPGVAKTTILGLQARLVSFQELFGLAKATLHDAMQDHQPMNVRLAGARATLEALKRTGEEVSLTDVARAEDAATLTQLAERILGAKGATIVDAVEVTDATDEAEAGPTA